MKIVQVDAVNFENWTEKERQTQRTASSSHTLFILEEKKLRHKKEMCRYD